MKKILAVLTIALVLLVGCSQDQQPPEPITTEEESVRESTLPDESPLTEDDLPEAIDQPELEEPAPVQTTDITINIGDVIVTATLDNSETTQAFLDSLPQTFSMTRYDNREFYGRIAPIPEDGEEIPDFENGDVTYYPAGPSLAIFYDREEYSSLSGLIRMGKITSDLSVFSGFDDTIEMLVQVAE